jgi:hypothetical protein
LPKKFCCSPFSFKSGLWALKNGVGLAFPLPPPPLLFATLANSEQLLNEADVFTFPPVPVIFSGTVVQYVALNDAER